MTTILQEHQLAVWPNGKALDYDPALSALSGIKSEKIRTYPFPQRNTNTLSRIPGSTPGTVTFLRFF